MQRSEKYDIVNIKNNNLSKEVIFDVSQYEELPVNKKKQFQSECMYKNVVEKVNFQSLLRRKMELKISIHLMENSQGNLCASSNVSSR